MMKMRVTIFLLALLLMPALSYGAAPSIDWLAPRIGPVGSTVTITGRGLCNGTPTVTIGGVSGTSVNCNSGYTLNFTVPSLSSGAKTVTVTNNNGTSNSATFTVQVFVSGVTKYVAASGGSDANPGTSGSPWATLAFAVTQVSAGDTILLRDGVYSKALVLRPGNHTQGTINAPITIKAENTGKAIWRIDPTVGHDINCGAGGNCSPPFSIGNLFIYMSQVNYYTIEGIQFDHDINLLDNSNYGIVCFGPCVGITIRNNTFDAHDQFNSGGVVISSDAYNIEVNSGETGQNSSDWLVEGNSITRWFGGDVEGVNTTNKDTCGNVSQTVDNHCYSHNITEYFVVRNNYTEGMGNGDAYQRGPWTGRYHLVEGNTSKQKYNIEENCIDIKQGDWITVRNNTCSGYRAVSSNPNGDAIIAHGRQNGLVFEGNILYNSGQGMTMGVGCCDSIGQNDVRIARNIFLGNVKVTVYGDNGQQDPTLGQSFGNGLMMNSVTNAEVVNNIFVNNAGWGLSISGGNNLLYQNNIWFDNLDGVIQQQVPAGFTIGKNVFFNASGERFSMGQGFETLAQFQARTGQAQGSTNADPLFINPTVDIATWDYHIATNSPATDLGVVVPGAIENFTGFAPDAGVYEGSGGPTPPIRSNGQPTGVLASGTTSSTISLVTHINASCKWSLTPNTVYASMANNFSTGQGTMNHSTNIS